MSSTLYDALERAVKALQAHSGLPPCISVSMTDDGLWVTPYIMGAPVSAILAWAEVMSEVEREFESYPTGDGNGYTKITVRGLLEDVPVIAQTVTFQDVNGTRGRVTLAELRRIAKAEEEIVPVST